MMHGKIEYWKLLLLSCFYIVFGFLSYTVSEAQVIGFFKISGYVLCGVGIIQIVSYFMKKEYEIEGNYRFSIGILLGIAGLVIAMKADLIRTNYPLALAGAVVLDSILRLQFSMDLLRIGNEHWKKQLLFALLPAILALGVLFVEMEPVFMKNYVTFLLWFDAGCIVYGVYEHRKIWKEEKEEE